jgi:hypothetical protein
VHILFFCSTTLTVWRANGDSTSPPSWRTPNNKCCWTIWLHVSPHCHTPQEGCVFCVLCHVSITLKV